VLHPSEAGLHINTIGYYDLGKYQMMFPNIGREDEASWHHFSVDEEDWVYHWTALPHVDAGKFKIIIKAHECSEPVKIREVKVVKTEEQVVK
jgi:hypothetical protein